MPARQVVSRWRRQLDFGIGRSIRRQSVLAVTLVLTSGALGTRARVSKRDTAHVGFAHATASRTALRRRARDFGFGKAECGCALKIQIARRVSRNQACGEKKMGVTVPRRCAIAEIRTETVVAVKIPRCEIRGSYGDYRKGELSPRGGVFGMGKNKQKGPHLPLFATIRNSA